MQFQCDPTPSLGDRRCRMYFTFLPLKFAGITYWLETVEVGEAYKYDHAGLGPYWIIEIMFYKGPYYTETNKALKKYYVSH